MRSNLTESSAMALISISSVSMVSGSRIRNQHGTCRQIAHRRRLDRGLRDPGARRGLVQHRDLVTLHREDLVEDGHGVILRSRILPFANGAEPGATA